ncbi:MAG TPA: DUF4430 domain-containing protein [Solirubrobacterales bacterium]|nr:DUF4430 domain-containing protein [Solirubrobacterales bacterium]
MKGPRTAVAIALLLAAIAAAGCGLGPGSEVGGVELTVTRDYGAVPVLHRQVGDVTEADTVMRVLERNADVQTSYGGNFVQSIDGLEGGGAGADDWFFYVNGLWSPIGAAEYGLEGDEAIWWDYRDWAVGERVAAAVGSWPQPFRDGYEGARHSTAVVCFESGEACGQVRERLREAGADLAGGESSGAIRVLVGTWARLRGDADAESVDKGVRTSGVFAEFDRAGTAFRGLDEKGVPGRRFGVNAGLIAATRHELDPPTWFVTGTAPAGVRAAAEHLDADSLRDHYALALEGDRETPLPLR